MRHVLLLLAGLALCGPPAAVASGDRLHLLAYPGGSQMFSPDADDPDATAGSATAGCGVQATAQRRLCQLTFYQGAQLEQPLRWSPERPMRFHAEADVSAPAGAADLTFFVQMAGVQLETPPAVQVAPGVWEAELKGPRSTEPATITAIGVRLAGAGASGLTVRTRGRSWVTADGAEAARPTRELIAADPRPFATQTHTTPERRFAFTDDDWSAHTSTGRIDVPATHTVTLPRAASAVYAWAEWGDRPAVQALAAGAALEPRWLTDSPVLDLRPAGGQSIGTGNAYGRAAANVPAGPLDVTVRRTTQSQDSAYTLHVVVVYGERTLRSMRWRSAIDESAHGVVVSQCPHAFEPLVVPAAATTFTVELTSSSPNPTSRWALAYDLPTVGSIVCGDPTTDAKLRFTVPRATRTWLFEPRVVTGRGPVLSVFDTAFEFEAVLTYGS